MKIIARKAVPTHIISGFLGAGKTTLLQHLLTQKPKNEVWAILMNEFGQIGVDQQLITQQSGYAVKELLGGCLCCSSQLPMQIALSRLLSESKPDRLFIEPTGLGHPAQLLEQLTEPHWHSSLDMRALVVVVDGSRLHDKPWVQQHLYTDQLKAAQVVVLSHKDCMKDDDQQAYIQLKQEYQTYVQSWIEAENGQVSLLQLDLPLVPVQRKVQPLLHQQMTQKNEGEMQEIKQLPYHYVETAQGYTVAGWKLPKRWQFKFYDVLDLLCTQQDWIRIKAIFYTDQGWKSFNFNPEQFNYKSTEESIDNRIEVIIQDSVQHDWLLFETQLLACRVDGLESI
ncbi:GTP-binding protein [Acinetobacter haemolyticus]|uniref:GTP-binding protein n=1 Tax=Acinetobacter haemolyticus TaxID=29430 RepID=A0AAJ2YQT4_ACIHA|nr:GTP-binding protein [Acinetobacter haemolyticus]NAR17490.1 GTP-binding protein [Acinetobacter haemolyticus]NAR29403.1 GTP-binding protein [Acinetobacter haemolyticus]NAR35379.1 GTP-binding protein [Acinetobacter haemolyticus]NAR46362.1 GTP-binding protein [Acinetobacter haemolyticus]NAR62891.1 GTP-binding protein [Acinetobacter haemolyticus]